MQQALARKEVIGARQARYVEEERRRRQGRRESLEKKRQLQLTRKGCICIALVMVSLFGLLFLVTRLNIAATQQGYRMKDLEQRIGEEKKEQESLRLDVARLESPARIEKIAIELLKMVLPVRTELVRMPLPVDEAAAARAGQDSGGNLGSAITPNGGSGAQ